MNIYKLAQGGIPPGYLEIEVEIDDKGNFKPVITGHGPGTKCGAEDEKLLTKLFGKVGEITDSGHTSEFFEGQKPAKPEEHKEAPFIGGPFGGPKGKEKEKEKMGLGFGV